MKRYREDANKLVRADFATELIVKGDELGDQKKTRDSLTPSLGYSSDAAIIYFMTSYITASSYEYYLPAIYATGCFKDERCSLAVSAASMATFGRRVRSQRYMDAAWQDYSKALKMLNASLADPEMAILDSTLATVLLCALFEAVVFEGGQSPTGWTAHTVGAMRLLHMRGQKQMENPLSRLLYSHACSNIKTSCIQRSVNIPPAFLAFTRTIEPLLDATDSAAVFAPLMERMAELKADSLTRADPQLLHEAWRLDRDVVAFSRHIPPYKPGSDVKTWRYLSHYDEYPDMRVVKTWSAVRLLRLFLVTLISDLSRLDGMMLPEGCSLSVDEMDIYATNNMDDLATEILASVPSFLETHGDEPRFSPPGRSLIWPLSILEKTPLCPERARKLVVVYLSKLAQELNLPHAVHPSRDPGSQEDWYVGEMWT